MASALIDASVLVAVFGFEEPLAEHYREHYREHDPGHA